MEIEQPYHICTKEKPYNTDMKVPVQHPSAFLLSEVVYLNEMCGIFFCPICQTKFHSMTPR